MSTVLVVDDDPVLTTLLDVALQRDGHDVRFADTIASGAKALESGDFDLVILDIFLPDGSGLELLREVRRRDGEIPVLVLTGHHQDFFSARAEEAGASAYMTKPFVPGELREAVMRLAG